MPPTTPGVTALGGGDAACGCIAEVHLVCGRHQQVHFMHALHCISTHLFLCVRQRVFACCVCVCVRTRACVCVCARVIAVYLCKCNTL